jgi:hypothetical protein
MTTLKRVLRLAALLLAFLLLYVASYYVVVAPSTDAIDDWTRAVAPRSSLPAWRLERIFLHTYSAIGSPAFSSALALDRQRHRKVLFEKWKTVGLTIAPGNA